MYLRGRVVDGDLQHIDALFNIVMSKHFRGKKDREELLAECRFSVIQLVDKRQYDPTKSALNYTYTRIRNHITNVLSKKCPSSFTEQGFCDGAENELLAAPSTPYDPEYLMGSVYDVADSLKIEGALRDLVVTYFSDLFGLEGDSTACYCSVEFYRQYLFYVRVIEWSLVQRHSGLAITRNKISDIVPKLRMSKSQESIITALSEVFSEELASFLLYVLAGQSIKLPPRNKLLKTDHIITASRMPGSCN